MNTFELAAYLNSIGVSDEDYVIHDLGAGEIDGVGFINGQWCTYFSQRGRYSNLTPFPDEDKACRALAESLRAMMVRTTGKKLPPPSSD